MLVSTKTTKEASVWRMPFAAHWPEYAIEGSCLGLFMISACGFGVLLFHPNSPAVRLIQNPIQLRVLMGLAMGTTAVALIYSRFGKRSGAHMNPAITGVGIASIVLGGWLSHPAVDYLVTLPGAYGPWWAFAAEAGITFVLMSV